MASRLAVWPSRPYSRAAKSRFSIGLSFLKGKEQRKPQARPVSRNPGPMSRD